MRYLASFVGEGDVFASRVTAVVHIPVGDLDMDPEAFAQATSGSSSFAVVKRQKAWMFLMRVIESESGRAIMHSKSPKELRVNLET